MSSLEDNHFASTSGSSGDSSDESFLRRPVRHDSFFKENADGNGTQFSVLVNEASIHEMPDEVGLATTGSRDLNDEQKEKTSFLRSQSTERRLANKISSANLRQSTNCSASGSTDTTPPVGAIEYDAFSSANSSKETVNTDMIMWRKRQSEETPIVDSHNCKSPMVPQYAHSGNEVLRSQKPLSNVEKTKRLSQRTVSTSVLVGDKTLDENIVDKKHQGIQSRLPYRSSSFYQGENGTNESLGDMDNNPRIEKAVKLFKMQVNKKASLTPVSLSGTQSIDRHPTSLLSSILVRPQTSPKRHEEPKNEAATMIPALRKVSGSSTPQTKNGAFDNEEPHNIPITANADNLKNLAVRNEKQTNYYNSEDEVLDLILAARKNFIGNKDLEMNMPTQRADVSSLSSQDSIISNFTGNLDFLSILRIILLLTICIFIPPLFFFIGLGSLTGFDDERLLLLLLRSEYRHKLITGFIWAVDLTWFRRLFLMMGIFELLALFACICVGFGVGLTR